MLMLQNCYKIVKRNSRYARIALPNVQERAPCIPCHARRMPWESHELHCPKPLYG